MKHRRPGLPVRPIRVGQPERDSSEKPRSVDKPDSQLTNADKAANEALWAQFNTDLFNPELDDLIDLIELIVKQEAPELQALGKKLQSMMALFRRTGQDTEPAEPDPSPEQMASQASSPPDLARRSRYHRGRE